MQILKQRLEITDQQAIQIPADAKILHVDNQQGELMLWFSCDRMARYQEVTIRIVGTGHLYEPELSYIGTAIVSPFVWHVFRK